MFYLLLSALCDSIWTIILSRISGTKDGLMTIAGVLLLIASILLFKKACSTVSLSIAVIVWSGLTIMCTIIGDTCFLGSRFDAKTAFFMLLCIISILGMNYYSTPS